MIRIRKEDKIATTLFLTIIVISIVIVVVKLIADHSQFDALDKYEYNESMILGSNMILLKVDDLGYYFVAEDDENIEIFIPNHQEKEYKLKNSKEGSLAWVEHVGKHVVSLQIEQ